MQKQFAILVIFCLAYSGWAAQCGFAVLAQHKKPTGNARILAKQGNCPSEALYDSVQVDTTQHFRILYTQKGPHAVAGSDSITFSRPPYIDTLMHWLEVAFTLEVDTIGMRAPQGPAVSYHFRDSRFSDKFPVEIIDIGLLRNTWSSDVFEGPCGQCYGLTYPDPNDPTLSTLFIDNDFRYQTADDPLLTIHIASGTCNYSPSTHKITTRRNGKIFDYTQDWATALRITIFHELYHTTQLRYQNYYDQYHFWFEASAVGVEELGAPDINDYLQYLPTIFSSPQTSLLDVNADSGIRPYGQGIFYQYLLHRFGLHSDPPLWERLSQKPKRDIALHFNDYFSFLGVPDGFPEVFADFARHLTAAGHRSQFLDPDSIWAKDLALWPDLQMSLYSADLLPNQPYSFRLFPASPSLSAWTPSASSGLRTQNISLADESFVIVSTGFSPGSTNAPKTPAFAYPNPWRGTGNLCFQLASDDSSIEIRDASGLLVLSIPRLLGQVKTCINGEIHQKLLVPGLYYWRGLSENSLHRFLVVR
jgi:hypothetical protein